MFRYIFKLALILLPIIGNSQLIDGKTYTPFNNFYKWRGGAFDTTLLIPQVASSSGKRPGSIYYNTSDSSVYSWSGSQWRRVSGDTTSLSNRINLKLNISDTSLMLSRYLRKADTLSLSNRINERVRYTDTAAMLNPYKFTAANGLTKDSNVFRLGGTLNQNTTINGSTNGLTFSNLGSFFANTSLAYIGNPFGEGVGVSSGRARVQKLNGTTSIGLYVSDSIFMQSYNGITEVTSPINSYTTDTSNFKILTINKTTGSLASYAGAWPVPMPTLQQVTTAGNTTTNDIVFNTTSESLQITNDGEEAKLQVINSGAQLGSELNKYGLILSDDIYTKQLYRGTTTRSSSITLADSSGILTQRVAINGTTYNTAVNGVVDLGNVDTATVVKAYVTNAEAVTITKGQVVYIFGASGDRAAVKLAKNTSDTFSSKTLGIVRDDIAAGQAGWVTTQGQVSGINLGAYSPGDILWLDSVPGGFTKVKPVAPKHGVFVGVVERANVGNGLIYVKPQNGVEVDEIHDILITSPTNNQLLAYTSSSGLWENKTFETVGNIKTGSATLDFGNTSAQNSSDLTITVTGVSDGDVVSLGVPNASVNANTCFTAWVSATDTVTVRFNNYSSGAIDPASGTFKIKVFK